MESKSLLFVITTVVFIFCLDERQTGAEVPPLPPNKASLFSLKDVKITGGQFKEIEKLDHEYLLSLEPDRLISWFRREAGLTPKAQPYPFTTISSTT